MKNNYKLGTIEAICIIIIAMINKLILNIPYYIVDLTGTGSIVNIFYIGIIDFFFLLIIIKIIDKFQNVDILDISEFLLGNKLKVIIGLLCIGIFLLLSFMTLTNFSNFLHTIYFSDFDKKYILLFFIAGILIANLIGFKSIAHTMTFGVPFAIISVLISFFAVSKNLDTKHLTPILGESYSATFGLGLTNSFALYIIIYYYFIKPLLKEPKKYKKICIISYVISLFLLLLTVVPMLTLFNCTSYSEPINSLFLLVRQIELGDFIRRVDALFILLWIFCIFSYLSFLIFIINKIIKKLLNVTDERMISFSTCSILFGLTILPINVSNINFLENTIYKYLILSFIFGIGIIILISADFKKWRGNK